MCNTEFNAIKSLKIEILDSKIYLNGFDDIINFLNSFNKDKFLYYLFFYKNKYKIDLNSNITFQKFYFNKIASYTPYYILTKHWFIDNEITNYSLLFTSNAGHLKSNQIKYESLDYFIKKKFSRPSYYIN